MESENEHCCEGEDGDDQHLCPEAHVEMSNHEERKRAEDPIRASIHGVQGECDAV